MWTDFFSRIVLINLVTRTDRLLESYMELKKYGIPFEVVRAVKNEKGQQGIADTLRNLFKETLRQGHETLLVFEDDVRMVVAPEEFNRSMDLAVIELPIQWDMLYLGANLPNPSLVSEYSAHLLKTKRALALHAVAYSKKGMVKILSLPENLPIDLTIADYINIQGTSFVTYPLLCTQRESFSDIEERVVDYSNYIEDRYKKVTDYLGLTKTSVT